jgi:hypothetical protein
MSKWHGTEIKVDRGKPVAAVDFRNHCQKLLRGLEGLGNGALGPHAGAIGSARAGAGPRFAGHAFAYYCLPAMKKKSSPGSAP